MHWRGAAPGFVAFALIVALATAALAALALSGSAVFRLTLDPYVWRALRFTLLQAGLSAGISVALAVPVALALAHRPDFRARSLILRLFALPLALPAIVAVLGVLTAYGQNGWINRLALSAGLPGMPSVYGLSGIVLAHVFFNLPLAVRLFLSALESLPPETYRLASQLGFDRRAMFRHIEGPALRAVAPGAAAFIGLLCVTSFAPVLLLGGGPAAATLEVAIYQALRFDFDPALAVRLALLQLALCAVLVLFAQWLGSPFISEPPVRFAGTMPRWGARAAGRADAFAISLAVAYVALPLCAVLWAGLAADWSRLLLNTTVWRAVATSLMTGMAAALLAVCLCWPVLAAADLLMTTRKGMPRRAGQMLELSTRLAIVMPPAVLGAGWFVLLHRTADPAHIAPVIVVVINALMAMPFAASVMGPALRGHATATGRLCAGLGLRGSDRWRLVDWPLLRRSLALAFTLAMLVSLGDLGAIALFGSESFITLPYLLYLNLGSYRTADAEGLALLLTVLCLIVVWSAERLARRSAV